MTTIAHKDIPEAGLHEPKGISTAASGTAYISNGLGTGVWQNPVPSDIRRVGFANYSDYATSLSPQSITASTWTKLTNDGLGSDTVETYLPNGITTVWNGTNSQFDFSGLSIGDMIDIYLDISITTNSANQYVELRIKYAAGDAGEHTQCISDFQVKTVGAYDVGRTFSGYIKNSVYSSVPAQIEIYSDDVLSVVVSDFYIKATIAV